MPNIQGSILVNLEIKGYGFYVYNLLEKLRKTNQKNNIKENAINPVVKPSRQMTQITSAEVRAFGLELS